MTLKSQAFEGFRCKTNDDTQLVVHSMILSYAADIHETEDLLGAKREIQTALPCNLCEILHEKL